MAGILAGFDPDNFRTQIRNTMIMGLPGDPADWPTFYGSNVRAWPTTYPNGSPIIFDDDGSPLDPTVAPLPASANVGIQVPCAVEFKATSADNLTLIGNFRDTSAVLTLLDTEYVKVKDAETVELARKRYFINYTAPPMGLGPVTVYQMYLAPTGDGR